MAHNAVQVMRPDAWLTRCVAELGSALCSLVRGHDGGATETDVVLQRR